MANLPFRNSIDFGGVGKVINAANPTDEQDYITLSFLKSFILNNIRDQKEACLVATTGSNITLTGSAPNVLDGVTLALDSRILVKDQTDQAQNGIYIPSVLGTGSNGTWIRTTDGLDGMISQGMMLWVTSGTLNARSGWLMTAADPITVGTSNITFVQVSALGDVTDGAGLSKSGNTLSVNVDGSTLEISGDALQIKTTYVGQNSITTVGTITTGTWNGTAIGVSYGGTGASGASGARSNLGAAASGANNDITSLTGLTTALSVAQGGTGGTNAAGARSNLGATTYYETTLTSGSTIYNVTHNLTNPTKPYITKASDGSEIHGVHSINTSATVMQLDFGYNLAFNVNVVIHAR